MVDKSTGEYYQPEHEDGGRQSNDSQTESVHKFEAYFCGTDKQFKKFVNHSLKELEDGGNELPTALTNKYPELLEIE